MQIEVGSVAQSGNLESTNRREGEELYLIKVRKGLLEQDRGRWVRQNTARCTGEQHITPEEVRRDIQLRAVIQSFDKCPSNIVVVDEF
jgi:hypothetical protein